MTITTMASSHQTNDTHINYVIQNACTVAPFSKSFRNNTLRSWVLLKQPKSDEFGLPCN